MGWFDKKSWQLRRKIRDLQGELAVAERDGKYVVAQGLFFAELQNMGEATMMVLGTADHFDAEEEVVIKNFFERNGFSVESLRLDKTQKTLASAEIIPPEELTRRVAKALQDQGFKLIDDSERQRDSNMETRVVTLSSLIHTISGLFASHVHHLIVTTPIKMNMEGNRLLHWMPLIKDSLLGKVPAELARLSCSPFIESYNHYYGQFGKMDATALDDIAGDTTTPEITPAPAVDGTRPQSAPAEPAPWADVETPTSFTIGEKPAFSRAGNSDSHPQVHPSDIDVDASTSTRAIEAAHTLARMYKSLIGANDQRKARNAAVILEYITRFFNARAACLLARRNVDAPYTLLVNCGTQSCVPTDAHGGVTCDTRAMDESLDKRSIVITSPGNGSKHPQAAAAPLMLDSALNVILYILEPSNFHTHDQTHISEFVQVFREFPDLLISSSAEKSETP